MIHEYKLQRIIFPRKIRYFTTTIVDFISHVNTMISFSYYVSDINVRMDKLCYENFQDKNILLHLYDVHERNLPPRRIIFPFLHIWRTLDNNRLFDNRLANPFTTMARIMCMSSIR